MLNLKVGDFWKSITPKQVIPRLIISAILFVFVSLVSVSFYAWKYGARFPLEGVHFGSLLISLTGTVAFLISIIIFEFTLSKMQSAPQADVKPTRILIAVSATAIMASTLSPILFSALGSNGGIASINTTDYVIIVFGLLLMAVIWLPLIGQGRFSNLMRFLGPLFYVVLLFLVVLPISTTKLPSFLRTIGYGGGLIVNVDLEDGRQLLHQGLFIRTNEYLVLYDATVGEFSEYPLSKISKISYNKDVPKGYILPCDSSFGQAFLEKYAYESVRMENCSGPSKYRSMVFYPKS